MSVSMTVTIRWCVVTMTIARTRTRIAMTMAAVIAGARVTVRGG